MARPSCRPYVFCAFSPSSPSCSWFSCLSFPCVPPSLVFAVSILLTSLNLSAIHRSRKTVGLGREKAGGAEIERQTERQSGERERGSRHSSETLKEPTCGCSPEPGALSDEDERRLRAGSGRRSIVPGSGSIVGLFCLFRQKRPTIRMSNFKVTYDNKIAQN